MRLLRHLVVCSLAAFWSAPASAQQKLGTAPVVSSASALGPKVPSGPAATAATIQGSSLDWDSAPMPKHPVRLRDARNGRILETQFTDKMGEFVFRSLDPGIYVVELMGENGTVLSASRLLSVDAGETMSASVKIAFRPPPLNGLLGRTPQQAAVLLSAAAASGVLTTSVVGVDASAR